jgi:hypothetical protein
MPPNSPVAQPSRIVESLVLGPTGLRMAGRKGGSDDPLHRKTRPGWDLSLTSLVAGIGRPIRIGALAHYPGVGA